MSGYRDPYPVSGAHLGHLCKAHSRNDRYDVEAEKLLPIQVFLHWRFFLWYSEDGVSAA